MSTEVDLNAISGLVQLSYDEDPVAALFGDEDLDQFMKHAELKNKSGGAGITVDIYDEGSVLVGGNYALAGGSLGSYRFTVKPVSIHMRARIQREALDEAAKSNSSRPVIDLMKAATDIAVHEGMRKLARHSAANWGELAPSYTKSGSTLTIDATLTNRLKAGMILVSTAAVGTALDNNAGTVDTVTILSWNDDTGVITCTGSIPASFTNGHVLFERIDIKDDGTSRCVRGLPAWLDPAPSATLFFGQNRTLSTSLRAKTMSCAGLDLRKAALRAGTRAYTQGITADIGFMSSKEWELFLETADAREIVNTSVEKKTAAGRTIVLGGQAIVTSNGNGGTIEWFQMPYLISGTSYVGNSKKGYFEIAYTDQLVRMHKDGQDLWRRVAGGVNDGTGEMVPCLEAEMSLRIAITCNCPNRWLTLTSFTGS